MSEITIGPAARLAGAVEVPGDKSISHRALILAALSRGTCRVEHLAPGADVRSTATCLARLGASVELEGGTAVVQGGALHPPDGILDCGNSGTTARLLAGVIAGAGTGGTLDGDVSLRGRPMRRVIEPLVAMGARIQAAPRGLLPLTVAPGVPLAGAAHVLEVASAQVKSSLLLAGLHARGVTSVREPAPSRDHTERLLRVFGVPVDVGDGRVAVQGPVRPVAPPLLRVPGDPSSAAFLVAAALVVPGSEIAVRGVCLNPTRTGLLRVLARMGARVEARAGGDDMGEPVGTITARWAPLTGTIVEPSEIPALVDEVPVLAAVATQARGRTEIRGAAELRVKESDRLARVAAGLTAMGARVRELPDGLVVDGPTPLAGTRLDGTPDHRLVMTFAVAALCARGETVIGGAAWAGISFPSFFQVLAGLGAPTRANVPAP